MPSLTQECMRLARPKQDLCLACAAERSSSQRDRNTTMPQKVCIVGSGNWGSAIARIVGVNAREHAEFEEKVDMWVFEEQVDVPELVRVVLFVDALDAVRVERRRAADDAVHLASADGGWVGRCVTERARGNGGRGVACRGAAPRIPCRARTLRGTSRPAP